MKKVKIGSLIPPFKLKDQYNNDFEIRSVIGRKKLVIYFYPKDESIGCTKEACSFRDSYEDFKELDAEVIGISTDSSGSHQSFMKNHRLPFILLSDPENKVRDLFDVPKSLFGLIPGRVTYIIDKKGIVKHIFSSQLQVQKHVETAVEILKTI